MPSDASVVQALEIMAMEHLRRPQPPDLASIILAMIYPRHDGSARACSAHAGASELAPVPPPAASEGGQRQSRAAHGAAVYGREARPNQYGAQWTTRTLTTHQGIMHRGRLMEHDDIHEAIAQTHYAYLTHLLNTRGSRCTGVVMSSPMRCLCGWIWCCYCTVCTPPHTLVST